jgi:hypothetical protein
MNNQTVEKTNYITLQIPASFLPEIERRVAALTRAKNAAQIEGDIYFQVVREWHREIPESVSVLPMCEVVLSTEKLSYRGWQLLGVIETLDLGDNIKQNAAFLAPGAEVEENLLREWTKALSCDHCEKKSSRKKAIIVGNSELDQVIRVGTTCVKNYLGHKSPAQIVNFMLMFQSFTMIDEDELIQTYIKTAFSPDEVVATTLHHMETNCYVSLAKAAELNQSPTSEIVKARLIDYRNNVKDCIKVPAEYFTKANEIMEQFMKFAPTSEFERNVNLAIMSVEVPHQLMGILISWAATYNYRQSKKPVPTVKNFVYFGEEGQKATLEMELTSVIPLETAYGQLYIHLFEIDTHKFVWVSSGQSWKNLTGTKVKVSFKVKEHSEYRGEKQTKIYYCRLAK